MKTKQSGVSAELARNLINNKVAKNILILGSGGLRVGQAGEFDYSGSQAIKAFKSDGYRVILVNPNIATVQTDKSMADKTYLVPLQLSEVAKIIKDEKIDLLALSFGGQTALNLGLELFHSGVLTQYNVKVLGSSIKTIEATEDRDIFRDTLNKHNISTPISHTATSVAEAILYSQKIGYPLMLRSGFSLGGLGSGKINNEEELISKVSQVLPVSPHVLLEEYLTGWKEFEYEIIRDNFANSLIICNMENLDPMGIHTGESIVIAPAQTLSDKEHQNLRNIALNCAEIFQIIGECNIQFAINPVNGDYRVIEMNPRLSRSSALASKATGYPLAYIAAKLCLGHALHELKNQVTKKTSAFFEPALDYVIVKIPRWDTHKLREASRQIGTEMKSVGEVMGIGRSFPEALQKAIQMLNIGASGLSDHPIIQFKDQQHLAAEIEHATDIRVFALYQWFSNGGSVNEAHLLSHIDKWFLNQIKAIADYAIYSSSEGLDYDNLLTAKKYGFSDIAIGKIHNCSAQSIRGLRLQLGVLPVIKQIDTVAGEFNAQTNYLYLTYHGKRHDVVPSINSMCILGSGPYAIGSSVEFDWCTVNLARELKQQKKSVIIINSNPETVSTDYDESDRLYFEPITLERVADILDFEAVSGVIVSVGGQIANNLALPLHQMGYPILGTSPLNINLAEDRQLFSSLLHDKGINQPRWISASSHEQINSFINEVGFPVLIRPSYVLSGAAMKVITNLHDLHKYLQGSTLISAEHSVVISEFITGASEVEVDGVASNGQIIAYSVAEHVEQAGVHSGDSTLIFPVQSTKLASGKIIDQVSLITQQIVQALNIHGPFNIQFLEKNQILKVIECNVRASRSYPFISKVSGCNLIELVAKVLLSQPALLKSLQLEQSQLGQSGLLKQFGVKVPRLLQSDYIGVKTPVFSYNRFKGSDPVAQVEMSSTGEVACIGDDLLKTFYRSWMATGQTITQQKILLSTSYEISKQLSVQLMNLCNNDWLIFCTDAVFCNLTTDIKHGLQHVTMDDSNELISLNQFGLVINIPDDIYSATQNTIGFKMRRAAIDYHIPLVTNLQVAKLLLASLHKQYSNFKEGKI